MVNDVSRAFFHAKAKREVYVQFPKQDVEVGEEQMCGRLSYSMYGARDATQNWYQEYFSQLVNIGIRQGKTSPRIFYHPDRNVRMYVRGDDYVSAGRPNQLKWMNDQLEDRYTVTTQTLGPGRHNQQQIEALNRILAWNNDRGMEYEADPRHIEIILKQLQLNEARAVTTPGAQEEGRTGDDRSVLFGD